MPVITEQKLTKLTSSEELKFQQEYARISSVIGLNPNPDDPRHFFDYRGLFKEQGNLEPDESLHFPSKFKLEGHPNLIVNGINTRTGQPVMPAKWSTIQDSNDFKALNPNEQRATQQRYFDKVISLSPDFQNLGQSEQIQTKNRFFSQGPTGAQRVDNLTDQKLLSEYERTKKFAPPFDEGSYSKQMYDELIRRGKTPQQIEFVSDVNKRLKPVPIGRTIGGIAGALALPAAINLIPGFAALPEEAITIPMALAKLGKAAAPIIGAGLGGGTGEAIQVATEEKRKITTGEFLKAFGTELAFEAAGRGAVRSLKFTFSPFIKRTIPEAAALAEDFAKFGGVLPPTALDKRFSLSVAEEISRGAFGARQVFEDLAQKNVTSAKVYASHFLDLMADGTVRLGPEQLGKEFAEGITRPRGRVFQMLDDLFTPLYKEFDEVAKSGQFGIRQVRTGEKPIRSVTGRFIPAKELQRVRRPPSFSTKSLKTFAEKELKRDKRLNKLILSPQGRSKFQKIVGLPDNVNAGDIRDLRSSFLKDVRKMARDANKDQALIKQIANITDDILFDPKAQRGLSNEASRLLRNTNNLYRASREGLQTTFAEDLGKRLVKNPSSVVKELFPRKNPTAIKNLRISLVEPIRGRPSAEGKRLWTQLRTAWFDDAVEEATKGEAVRPHIFDDIVRRQGKEAIAEMIPDATGKRQLRNIKDLLTAVSKKPAAGASLFIRGGQVGGLYLMYDGARSGDFLQVGTGGALVMGPYFFAKMAAHPLGSKLVRIGIRLKPGAGPLVPIAARLINLANKIDRDEFKRAAIRKREERIAPRFHREIQRGRGIEAEQLTGIGLGF